jgi:CHAT domain-containing protein/tetratricopeptide (TPR) repeat protein
MKPSSSGSSLSVILATTLLLSAHCKKQRELSPDAIFRSIERTFVSGDLAAAEKESSFFSRRVNESDVAWQQRFRVQRAKIWFWQGHSAEALALLVDPFPAPVRDDALAASRSSLLALAYNRTGDIANAQREIASAERKWPSELCPADLRLAEGIVDGENGKLSEAERAFGLSLVSAQRSGDSLAQTQALLNLGVAAERQEHYDEALDLLSQSAILASSIDARLMLAKASGARGWAFYKLGDYRRALESSQIAETQAAALGASIDQVEWLNNAGLSQFRLGDLTAARASYEQSYQLALSLHNDEEIGDSLLALAYLSLETGDLSDALSKSREVERLAAQKGNPDDALEPTLIEAVALGRQGQRSAAREKLLALEKTTATGEAGESVRWETENALATLAADSGDPRMADHWFGRAIQTFRLQRASLGSIDSRLPFFENGSSLYLGFMEQLIHEGRTSEALTVLDQSRAETLAEGLGLASEPTPAPTAGPGSAAARRIAEPRALQPTSRASPQALARRLGGTILVYCLRPGTSYLWAISPTRTELLRLPGRETILPLVAAHTQGVLASRDLLAQAEPPGAALYRNLVEPALPLIAPRGKVFLIADEALNALNFETLPIPGTPGAAPHYWIEDADIVNARSIALLAATHGQRARTARRLLLVGDPAYNQSEYARLPHASEEMARVAGHFPPGERLVLSGAEATPPAYQRSHPETFAYIHFVAHATASDLSPLDSSVILSPPSGNAGGNTGGDAGPYKLYARSILDQRLNADLVTISSCYGSGVRSYSGEGLVGLAWAFLHSGSHHVIAALWEVSDVSTPQLMSDMYDSLYAGQPPDVALRSAKLAMIRNGGVFRKPFYWGAFQLYAGA